MASTNKRPSPAEWLKYKPRIRHMIVEENKSQKEARQLLEDDEFFVTKAQLEYKLKIWGFRKKVPKNEGEQIWQFIDHRVGQRTQKGKTSEVILDGRVIDPAKVRKETNRHQPTTIVRYAPEIPRTPEGVDISICTPAAMPMRFTWPSSLPWLQFQPKLSHLLSSLILPKHTFNTPFGMGIQGETLACTNLIRFNLEMSENSTSRLAAEIGSVLPETFDKENVIRAQQLLLGPTCESYKEHVKIVLYSLSNNLESFRTNEFEGLEQIFRLLEDSRVTETHLQFKKTADNTTNAVAEKIFQSAITAASWYNTEEDLMKSPTWRIIMWLLDSGQNPNTPIPIGSYLKTPLQMAMYKHFHPTLAMRLLDAGADPNLAHLGSSPLVLAIKNHATRGSSELSLRLIKCLIEKDASNYFLKSFVLMEVLKCGINNRELIDNLIQNGADVLQRFPSDKAWFVHTQSILGCSFIYCISNKIGDETKAVEIFLAFLEHAILLNPETSLAGFITPDDVVLAASWGCERLLSLYHSLGINLATPGHNGYSALHAAAYYGHLDTCKWLIAYGIVVDGLLHPKAPPSPMCLAAHNGHHAVVKLLHRHGANVNYSFNATFWCKPHSILYSPHYPYFESIGNPIGIAILSRSTETYMYLAGNGASIPGWAAYHGAGSAKSLELVLFALRAGANQNWRSKKGETVLQAALQQWNVETMESMTSHILKCVDIASTLLDAGAIPVGDEIQSAMLLGDLNLVNRINSCSQSDRHQQTGVMSMLEAAFISGNPQIVETAFTWNPNAYDPSALCASIILAHSDDNAANVHRLLYNRQQSASPSPLEHLAIGIAAWYDMTQTLDLLLANFSSSLLAIPLPIDSLECYAFDHYTDFMDKVNSDLDQDRVGWEPFWRGESPFYRPIRGSPLVLALESEESLARLLEHGYRPDRLTMYVAALKHDSTIIRKLSQYPRLIDEHGEVPGLVSECVRQNDLVNVQFLLSEGEDANEDNSQVSFGRSPLQQAVEDGNLALMELLIKAGANVNAPAAKVGGATALQFATITGRLGIARELRELGADVDAPGAEEHGRTALEGAAEHGRIDMVRYLLDEGARTTGPGQLQYLRAIKYAQDSGHMVVVDLLKGYRERTADDDTLWEKLVALSRDDLEKYEIEARAGELVNEDDGEIDTVTPSVKGFSDGEESSGDDEADNSSSDHLTYSHTDDNGANPNPCLEDLGLAAIEDLEMITDDFMALMDTGRFEWNEWLRSSEMEDPFFGHFTIT